jgi:hypothetical protein
VTLEISGADCTGVYEGAGGETDISLPQFKEAGHLIVATEHGDVCMTFLEWLADGKLDADLRVDGVRSTGKYKGAEGELRFSLQLYPTGAAKGPYSGTIRLRNDSGD